MTGFIFVIIGWICFCGAARVDFCGAARVDRDWLTLLVMGWVFTLIGIAFLVMGV